MQKCPFNAIEIINLPKALDKETTHRYGVNTFKLHRLPIPKLGNVVGLVGRNGTGKSTALKILSGDLIPNLGRFDAIIKPQYVDDIRKKASDMIVGQILEQERCQGR
ncbi:ABC transporter E family member 2, partial [Tanacetum coccineum]